MSEEKRYLRGEVRAFARLMEKKLREHDDRPGWKDCDPEWLLDRLLEEFLELWRAVRLAGEDRDFWVPKEAADVANFAMMIVDICGALEANDE